MLPSEILVSKFDFRKFKDTCQDIKCNKNATSKAVFKEVNIRKQHIRNIAEIRLCNDHVNACKMLCRELNNASKEFTVVRVELWKI